MPKEVSMYAIQDAHTVGNIVPQVEWLRADHLKSANYQRVLQPSWARRIAREFDPDKLWPLIISRRADGDYVLDGQHRLYAIRDVLNWGDQKVPCMVYQGLTPALETKLFNTQSAKGRKPITALDELHARYIGGEENAVAIVRTVERAGLAMDWHNGSAEGSVRAAAVMQRVYGTYGSARLLDVLALLRDSFGRESRVFQAPMLVGMAAFLMRYAEDESYVRTEFVRKVGRAGVDEVLQRSRQIAAGLGSGASGASAGASTWTGRAMQIIYNRGRRTLLLPEWAESVRTVEAAAAKASKLSEYQREYPRLASDKGAAKSSAA